MIVTRRLESTGVLRRYGLPRSAKEIQLEDLESLQPARATKAVKEKSRCEKTRFCGQQAAKDGFGISELTVAASGMSPR
jgi:hypothetical protein